MMEENKETSLEEDSLEEETTQIPEKAKQLMDIYLDQKEQEREAFEAIHRENMKDLSYRRWYYQNEIEKHMNMIPKEYYYQAEYEEMETLCEKCIKKIDSLSDEKDMEAVLKEFRRKTGKKFDANKVVGIILAGFLVLFIGFLVYLFIIQ